MSNEHVFTEVDLKADGILWMLNTAVFHPRGLALTRDPATGRYFLQGDGEEVWSFEEDLAQARKDAFDEMIARHLHRLRPAVLR